MKKKSVADKVVIINSKVIYNYYFRIYFKIKTVQKLKKQSFEEFKYLVDKIDISINL